VPRQFRYRKKPDEVVELFWQEGDALTIQATKAVYLLRKRRTREILYIGKASRQSVGRRWLCRSKERLHKLAKKERVQMCPLVAGLHTSRRITPQLIDDVERPWKTDVSAAPSRTGCPMLRRVAS
jgi:hypothetical protein